MKPHTIAIFQSHSAIQSHTILLARFLALNGFYIDLFLNSCEEYYPVDHLKQFPGIQIIYCAPSTELFIFNNRNSFIARIKGLIKKFIKRVYGFAQFNIIIKNLKLLSEDAESKVSAILDQHHYDCFIGIEKEGFILASQYGSLKKVPYLYYSLELYDRQHPLVKSSPRRQTLHALETKLLGNATAVVIQDSNRAEAFLKDHSYPHIDTILLPISLETYLYNFIPNISHVENEFDLIQIGTISKNRLTLNLVEVTNRISTGWRILLHGGGERDEVDYIRSIAKPEFVSFSLDPVKGQDLPIVVSRAKVGLALYAPMPINDRLTMHSSEKIAMYLMCGKPIIVFDYEGSEMVDEYNCGKRIHTLEDIPHALQGILENYDWYHANAYRCFQEQYRYNKNAQEMLKYIQRLAAKS